jgi:hypothetical protein
MLEETTPRTSSKWKPHQTFASTMNMAGEKHMEMDHQTETVGTKETSVV